MLARPLRVMRNRQVLNSLIEEGRRVFDLMLKGDEEQIPRYWEILACLEQRKDAEGEEFLLSCFEQCGKLGKVKAAKNTNIAGADLMGRLALLIYNIGSPKGLEALLEKRELLPFTAFAPVLRSALRTWPAEKVFNEFAPLLEQKKGAGKEKSEELQRTIWSTCQSDAADPGYLAEIEPNSLEARTLNKLEWDPRWLDAAIKADLPQTVCCLAKPDHKGAVAYLSKLADGNSQFQSGMIIQALARCQYPQITDVFLELVAKKTGSARYFDYDLQLLFGSARYLPATDLSRLDAFAAKLDEKFVDKFLEALEPLRPIKQPN